MLNFFYSLISFFVAIFFILLGVISVMIPWFSTVRTDVIQFILEDFIAISFFGFSFLAIGIGIVFNILIGLRRNYYHFKVGSNSVAIDESILQKYLNTYWQDLFPGNDIPNRLILKKNKIHVIADLPYMTRHQQEVVLERIKTDLRDIFGRLLGYHHQFHLSASFQDERRKAKG